MKKLICVFLLSSVSFLAFSQKIDIQVSIGSVGEAPYHVILINGVNVYQAKVLYEISPTWNIGIGFEKLVSHYLPYYPVFAELNRDFHVSKRAHIIGGAILGATYGKLEGTAPATNYPPPPANYLSGTFGFDIGLCYDFTKNIGVKIEMGGLYTYDVLIFPGSAGVIVHL